MKTTKLCLISAAAICAVWLAGCSTPETRIRDNPETYAQLTPQQQELVRAGRVGIGFDMASVKLALGAPDRITLRTDGQGETQVWHYVEYAYYDAGFLYPGWGGGWVGGRGYGRHGGWGGWGGGWGWGGMMDDYAVPYDHFRIEFKDGKVSSINEELPPH
jgi:hypothetical protein